MFEVRIISYQYNPQIMSKPPLPRPTESELEILQVLWQHGPTTVRFVNDELSRKRDVGYTTTLKLL